MALEDGDAAAAERLLDEALRLGHPHPERVAGFHLWRGRARDVQGKRDAARGDYRAVLGRQADAAAREQALKSLKRPYHKVRMSVDFVLGDVTA